MLNFEHKKKPLLPVTLFYKRMLDNVMLAIIIILISLSIGIAGYMIFADLNFVDALLNASMILGGMGPVDVLTNNSAKIFASCYSLFSGITFLSTVALLLAPAIHRAMHKFNLETEEEEEEEKMTRKK